MADISLPYTYTTNNVQTAVFNTAHGFYSEFTATDTIDTDMVSTINSYEPATGVVNITISSTTTINRGGTIDTTHTYSAAPQFRITSGGNIQTVYSSSATTSRGTSGAVTIVFSTTFNYTLPAGFAGNEWTITHYVQVTDDSRGYSSVGESTSTGFTIPVGMINAIFFGTNF
jgi:hypothetical protein